MWLPIQYIPLFNRVKAVAASSHHNGATAANKYVLTGFSTLQLFRKKVKSCGDRRQQGLEKSRNYHNHCNTHHIQLRGSYSTLLPKIHPNYDEIWHTDITVEGSQSFSEVYRELIVCSLIPRLSLASLIPRLCDSLASLIPRLSDSLASLIPRLSLGWFQY